jgi:cytochrome c556
MSLKFGVPLASIALLLAGTAVAAGAADAIAARQANFKAIGKANKALRDELAKPAPDAAALKANADALVAAAGKVGGFFPRGSGPESGVQTKALPVIWEKSGDFNKVLKQFAANAKLVQAAATKGDTAQLNVVLGQLGQTCKGCHDQFRAK